MSLTAEQLADECAKFVASEFGQQAMTAFGLMYNGLHQEAENAVTSEEKAFKVERAAGLKEAISWFQTRAQMSEQGTLRTKEPEQP